MKSNITPLRRETGLPQQLVQEFKGLIMSGQWPAGSRIPTERELCEQYDVSRSVVREAVSVLVCFGVLRTRQGGGVFVCHERDASWVDLLTPILPASPRMLEELMTLRKAIEPLAAALTAERKDPEAFAELRAAHRLIGQADNVTDRVSAGLAFHTAIARTSGNQLLLRLITNFLDLFTASHRITLETEAGRKEGIVGHEDILEAIESGDSEHARQTMYEHLMTTEQLLKDIISGNDVA